MCVLYVWYHLIFNRHSKTHGTITCVFGINKDSKPKPAQGINLNMPTRGHITMYMYIYNREQRTAVADSCLRAPLVMCVCVHPKSRLRYNHTTGTRWFRTNTDSFNFQLFHWRIIFLLDTKRGSSCCYFFHLRLISIFCRALSVMSTVPPWYIF